MHAFFVTMSQVYGDLTHVVDLTATIAAAAVLEFPKAIDGLDIVGAALGVSNVRTAVPINIFDLGLNFTAVRWGKWKVCDWEARVTMCALCAFVCVCVCVCVCVRVYFCAVRGVAAKVH